MELAQNPKLAFVLPEYATHTHFRYVGEFAVALLEHLDIVLVLEKGDAPPGFPRDKVRKQKYTFPFLRFFEMGWILFSLHRKGYNTQYVHYSFVAGFWSALWVKIFGGSMYYWNAGMPWLYKRPPLREWFERLVFRMIDHLLTGADALHEGYATYYGIARERILTLPNWVDVAGMQKKCHAIDTVSVRGRLHIPDGAQVLLFVHRLAARKGAHLLPEIFAGLQKDTKGKDRILVVLGDGPERQRIEDQFRAHGLSAFVRMEGSVPQERVHEYYAIANLFLLPSQEEGFPHVLTEAQAIGLPYVASDVGGVREMTPPIGHPSIVPYGDVPSFILAAKHLLEDDADYEHFSTSAREWVRQYDKAAILERFLASIARPS